MVCLSSFRIPIAWPLEIVPKYKVNAFGRLLNNPFAMIIGTHYLHLVILTHVPVPMQYLESNLPNTDSTERVLTLKNNYVNGVFMIILGFASLLYVVQWIFYFGYVRNKRKYIQYGLYSFLNSCPIYFASFFFAYASSHLVFPFGIFYVSLLPFYMRQHVHILVTMNNDSENLLTE
jgi:hypothetical protein